MPTTTTDRIEKSVLIRAPRPRVWRAISQSKEFGNWFGCALTSEFAPGRKIEGSITHGGPDDPRYQYRDFNWEMVVDRIEPERLFSFRWHPFAVETGVDYSDEPMTLVEFTLEDVEGGTLLKVVESGFDSIPMERRAAAFESNEGGWAIQVEAVRSYVEGRAG